MILKLFLVLAPPWSVIEVKTPLSFCNTISLMFLKKQTTDISGK